MAEPHTQSNELAFFTSAKPVRLFFRMALPGAVSMVASVLYQFLDGIFVGRILGAEAFAALNLAFPFVIINFAIADLVGVGSAVPISICLGRQENAEADNIFSCACILIVASGAVLGAALYAGAPLFMRLLGAEGGFAARAAEYLRVYALCSPVTTIVFAMDNYLKICGRVKTSMALNIVMSFLGAGLEFLFLFVFGTGIWGAAAATCLSMMVCAVLAVIPFARRKMQLRFRLPHFSRRIVARILSCGTPTFLSNISGRITSILMNLLLVRLGGAPAVSIYGMLMYADGFVMSLLYGSIDSVQPAVGYNYGAGRRDRVRAIEACCFTASGVLSVVLAAVLFLFPEAITALFLEVAAGAFRAEAAAAMRIFSLTYLSRWFSFTTQSYMLAIGKSAPASAISVATAFVFPVILLAAFYPAGLTGIWLNFPSTAFLAALLSAAVLIRERRRG